MRVLPINRFAAAPFWALATFKHGVIVAACGVAMWIQLNYRVPGHFLLLLIPLIGVTLIILNLILLINHLVTRLPEDDPFRITLSRIQWWSNLLVRVFVYYSLLLYVNAKLDSSEPMYRAAEVIRISEETDLGFPIPYRWINVRYRDDPGKTERMLLTWSERANSWGAAPVVVTVRGGRLGIPWVSAIERDWESYGREILKLAPAAANVQKQLIFFYLMHDRLKEGVEAAHEYLKFYRNDYDTAYGVGSILFTSFQYADSVPFFEHAAARHPTYESYQALGTALSWAGQNPRAAEVLEASIALNPDDWEAYYHLGYVYGGMGRLAEGIAAFEKALERRPNSLEVEIELKRLRKALAAVQAAQQAAPKRREQVSKPSR